MAAFMDDVVFPVHISRGSTGGPDWLVDIVTLNSGHEERNSPWAAPRRTYDAKWSVRTAEELYDILKVYLIAGGPLRGFRMLDWSDFKSCNPSGTPTAADQVLGLGDGLTTQFSLWKSYQVGAREFLRRIEKPFGTIRIAQNLVQTGSGWTVDMNTGVVTFDTAPAAGVSLTWGGQFHVPVRFDGKLDQMTLRGEYNDIPSIPLREIRP